ncbi:hypothetical protein MBLNU459_g7502t1 [Dothideomycetes sp. NU459]
MTQTIKITYNHAGLQPPVYIAGSLGELQWQPVEMNVSHKEDGEAEFWREFDAEEGEYQYKFRLGPGDWWVLDESKPTVDDGAGNRNNMIVVKPLPAREESINVHVMDQATVPVQDPEKTEAKTVPASAHEPVPSYEEGAEAAEETPLTKSEVHSSTLDSSTDRKPVDEEAVKTESFKEIPARIQEPEDLTSTHDEEEKFEPSPLFPHESFACKRHDSKLPSVSSDEDADDDEPQQLLPHEALAEQAPDTSAIELDDFDDDEDYEDEQPPLFRHESFAPEEADESVPLFRHETMSEDTHERPSARSVRSNSSASFASYRSRHVDPDDINDPSLEKFPTDQASIMAHLQRTETRLPEDETSFEGTPSSPSMASSRSFGAETSPAVSIPVEMIPLSQVTSAQLDCITESEEELSPERPAEQTRIVEDAPVEPPARKQTPKLSISPSHEPVRGPLTPPMTPIDDLQSEGNFHKSIAETFDEVHLQTPEKAYLRKDNPTDQVTAPSKALPAAEPGSKSDGKHVSGVLSSLWDWFAEVCGGRLQATGVAVAVGVASAVYAMTGRERPE